MENDIDIDAEVSVKDIINFYVKINDSSKAKKDIARLSAKDKAAALEIIAASSAGREFRIEVARYFIYDLDAVVRRKAERFMEDLVPDWVTDPAESILKLLKPADTGWSHGAQLSDSHRRWRHDGDDTADQKLIKTPRIGNQTSEVFKTSEVFL